MSGADLVPYLPLIGAVLGAVIGGFVGAHANGRTRRKEEREARDQELRGLMVLLSHEYLQNRHVLEALARNPVFIQLPSWTDLHTSVWGDARIRLSQTLTTEHTAAFALYYSYIESVIATIKDDVLDEKSKTDNVTDYAAQADRYGRAAMGYAAQYIFVDHPNYTDDMHERLVELAGQLTKDGPKPPTNS